MRGCRRSRRLGRLGLLGELGLLLAVCSAVAAQGCDCDAKEAGREVVQQKDEAAKTEEPAASEPRSPQNPLLVSGDSYDFSKNPKLLRRIHQTPHGYFRFINRTFSEQVCQRFQAQASQMPRVNLHGDAHLEQYAVTDLGRGLTDFDDSSTGPGVIDLLRFGVSIELALFQSKNVLAAPEVQGHALITILLAGYKDALRNPQITLEVPRWAKRMRGDFKQDRPSHLAWAETLMSPMRPDALAAFERLIVEYAEGMRAQTPSLPEHFYQVRSKGQLHMGIGSALDEKYLIRIEGPTKSPTDDIIVEAKEVRDLSGISCIANAQDIDPFRILVGQSRLAYEPYEHLGFVAGPTKTFWLHAWTENYKELSLDSPPQSADELREIIYDVGAQLGLGHVKQIAAPHDAQLRRVQLRLVERLEGQLATTCDDLAAQTVDAWRLFKKATKSRL